MVVTNEIAELVGKSLIISWAHRVLQTLTYIFLEPNDGVDRDRRQLRRSTELNIFISKLLISYYFLHFMLHTNK